MRTLLTAVLCVFGFQTADQSQNTPALTPRIVLPNDVQWLEISIKALVSRKISSTQK